jgi:hypothetical protein
MQGSLTTVRAGAPVTFAEVRMIETLRTESKYTPSQDYQGENLVLEGLVTSINTQLGSDPNQHIWILECSNCGHEYQINSSNWDMIKCPKCRGAANASIMAAARGEG